MTVTEGWFAGTKHASAPEAAQLNSTVREALEANISLNSKAFVIDKGPGVPAEFVGNRTECALLVLAGKWGCDYKVVREAHDNKIAEVRGAGLPLIEWHCCLHACLPLTRCLEGCVLDKIERRAGSAPRWSACL